MNYRAYAGYGVLTTINMKSGSQGHVVRCKSTNLLEEHRLHYQGWRINRAKYQRESGWQAELPGILHGFFYVPEDGSNIYHDLHTHTLQLTKLMIADDCVRELISINIMEDCQLSPSGVKKMNDGHKLQVSQRKTCSKV
jgi:hypothetical protein